ncbi:hypothetical protein CCYA_CCYA16G4202 [Cyanidiococcus yangmingshanensis]|nr:hypothetical protein CCYA_CCYA16G4202 [Cyanidiococcus yangmingshanensis]
MKRCTQFVISVQYKYREYVHSSQLVSLGSPRSEPGVKRAARRRAVLALQDEPGKRLDDKQATMPSPNRKKKVTRAAALQESLSFSDAWAARNRGRIDVWFVIGLLFILLPLGILIWGVATGVIPYMS